MSKKLKHAKSPRFGSRDDYAALNDVNCLVDAINSGCTKEQLMIYIRIFDDRVISGGYTYHGYDETEDIWQAHCLICNARSEKNSSRVIHSGDCAWRQILGLAGLEG